MSGKNLDKALLSLYVNEPLISAVLSRMRLVQEPDKDYVAKTDGRRIWVGKAGLELPYRQLTFVLAHEVMHALSHHTSLRRPAALKHVYAGMQMDENTRRLWNLWAIACDVSINTRLEASQSVKSGRMERPRMDYYNASKVGLSREWVLQEATEEQVFEALLKENFDCGDSEPDLVPAQSSDGVAGEGSEDGEDTNEETGDAGAGGGGQKDDTPLSPEEVESALASVSVMRGASAGGDFIGKELVAGRYFSGLDWRKLLTEALLEPQAGGDVTWSRRSRRSHVDDVILPASRSYAASLYVVVDVSGSVLHYVEKFLGEVRRIIESVDLSYVQVIVHDDELRNLVESHSKDEMLMEIQNLRVRSGGGTRFASVIQHIVRECKGANPPTAVVWLTDLECTDTHMTKLFLSKIPKTLPFFWVVPDWLSYVNHSHITCGKILPFGDTKGEEHGLAA